MVSGVGPSAQLQAQNITVVMDQPHVGQGMHDNPMNAVLPAKEHTLRLPLCNVFSNGNFIRIKFNEVIISPTFSRRLYNRHFTTTIQN
ncbi:hypothetical protein F2Q70_00019818 [Brassica cretica]|uniref:Glucose-methanol-choline oxidoreductase N-terminal domain-containing protein n=1 Tax=Brassica cretica TaxID=69181 RepID=A0A8S9GK86_BRACR|nr:hypothetical protein F2Q70_00019818 [Brassica cretica]